MQSILKRSYTAYLGYLLLFTVALAIRLYHLGAAPLSDFEARLALQARALLHGQPIVPPAQPLSLSAVTAFFFLLGESNFAARLFSALMGSGLVLIPWFWRETIGQRTALLTAAALTFAPGLLALSRLAGGPMPAIVLGLAALSALYTRRSTWGGLSMGLFVLSGPWALTGLLGLALTLGIARGSGLPLGGLLNPQETAPPRGARPSPLSWRQVGLWSGASLLLGGSLFLRFPQILGGLGETLSAFLRNLQPGDGQSVAGMFAAVTFYHLLIVLLALGGAWLVWRRDILWGRLALLWSLAALLMAVPLRQPFDAVWALIPLSALGAYALNTALEVPAWRDAFTWGYAALLMVLGTMCWLVLAGLPADATGLADTWRQWSIVGGALMVGVLSGVLIAKGWQPASAQLGGILGGTVLLGLVMVSQGWGITQVRPLSAAELWYPSPAPARLGLLTRTLGDAAEFHAGRRDTLSVRLDVDSPALAWALRDFELSTEQGTLPLAVITTEDAPAPNAQVRYLGQSFAWRTSPAWHGALPPAAMRWFIFREAPVNTAHIILWLRGDLFPGGSVLPDAPAQPSESTEQLTP